MSTVKSDAVSLKASISSPKKVTANISAGITKSGSTTDHRQLTNRDAPDQHPISAIEELPEILERIDAKIDNIELTPGADGVSVITTAIDGTGHLIITLSNGTSIDAGIAKGERGEKGERGDSGLPGHDGTDGKDGISVTGTLINVDGHLITMLSDGTSIDAGIAKGADGKDGAQGIQGLPGEKGDKGDKGDPGEQGLPGHDGIDGKDGADADTSQFYTKSEVDTAIQTAIYDSWEGEY